jgi:hypothetical protein
MCHFVSWIEKDKDIYFLTANDLNTPEGRKLKKYLGDQYWEDIMGHGAIRQYYGLSEGINKECTDFSNPKHLPDEIVKAIKCGAFRGIAIPDEPGQFLLSKPLADYEAKRDALDADYEAKRDPLYADFRAKRDPLYADYEAKRDALDADYEEKRAQLYADYKAQRDALDSDYEAKRHDLFWDIFSKQQNRKKIWR